MPQKVACEMVSWAAVVSLAQKLAVQIQGDNYHPDIIVAIGRGGYVPARLLADYLDMMNLTSIKIEHYFRGLHKHPVTTVIYPLSIDVTDQRVLLVDDVSDSGETFEVALQHIQQRSKPQSIRTAVLHHKVVSSYTPDYYGDELHEWRWLTYPWAQVEDIGSFIEEMDPAPETVEELAQELESSYGLRVDGKLLDYILHRLELERT